MSRRLSAALRLSLCACSAALSACGAPAPAPAPPAATTHVAPIAPAPASSSPPASSVPMRKPDEPRVVALSPLMHYASSPERSADIEGFDLRLENATLVGGKGGKLLLSVVSSVDARYQFVKRIDGGRALFDRQSHAFSTAGPLHLLSVVGPKFLVGFGGHGLTVVDRATGKELKAIEVQNSPGVLAVTTDARVLEDDPTLAPSEALTVEGAWSDRARLLSLPDLSVVLEVPARVVLRRPDEGSKFLLESWKKGPVHQLHILDAEAGKLLDTIPVPAGSGDPLPSVGMDPPPRHEFAASTKRIAMAFGDGVWALDRKTRRWTTLRPLTKDKKAEFPINEYDFRVGITATDEVCVTHSGKALVFPAPRLPRGAVLRVALSQGVCRAFHVTPPPGFAVVQPSRARRYEAQTVDVSADGRLALSVDRQQGRDKEPVDYRAVIVDLASGAEKKVISLGKRDTQSIDDRYSVGFTDDGKIFATSMGHPDFGGLFSLDGAKLSPALRDGDEHLSFEQTLALAGLNPKSLAKIELKSKGKETTLIDPSGNSHPVELGGHSPSSKGVWLENGRVALFGEQNRALVLHVPKAADAPAQHIATLVPRPKGIVTLLRGGGFHASGVDDADLGCVSGDTLAPIASCRARFFVEDGLRLVLAGRLPPGAEWALVLGAPRGR